MDEEEGGADEMQRDGSSPDIAYVVAVGAGRDDEVYAEQPWIYERYV